MRLFEQRFRGFRLIELVGLVLVLCLVLWVCISKAREGEDIRRMNELDRRIAEEKQVVGALRIKVAQLERPGRLEQLAVTYLGMKPVAPNHEAKLETLGEISRTTSKAVATTPTPAAVTQPVAAVAADPLISVSGHQAPAATGGQ
ncbi:MAG: septum formation inhibitor MinC [Asticcacaulis sp.]